LFLTAAALVWLPAARATAQGQKPVAIVSVASVEENSKDIGYLMRAAGMEGQGVLLQLQLSGMSSGVDKNRPIGVYILPKETEFEGIGFFPLEAGGLDKILKKFSAQFGEPKDAGNGILKVGKNGATIALKEVQSPGGNWLFVGSEASQLDNLPADPTSVLGDLPKTYNVAGRLFLQNIPEKLRRTVIDNLKFGVERVLSLPQAQQGKFDRDQALAFTTTQVAAIEKLMNESEELMIGVGIDEPTKRILVDVSFSGKDGTSLAHSMSLQVDVKSNFGGFLLPDATVSLNIVRKSTPEEIAQAAATLQLARGQWLKQIDDVPGISPNKRDAIKSLVGPLFDVVNKTSATGQTDFGAAVILQPKALSFAAGGVCADGPGLQRILKSLAEYGTSIDGFPRVELDFGTLGELKLNRMTAPIPAGHPAQEVFGNNLEIIIGIGPKSVLIAGGKDAQELLRKIVDRSAQAKNTVTLPAQVNVGVLPILKFLKSFDDGKDVKEGLGNLIATLEQAGNDHVTVTSKAMPRSNTTRVEVQEGVITAIGAVVKRFLSGGE
jgi:hypothetical protein